MINFLASEALRLRVTRQYITKVWLSERLQQSMVNKNLQPTAQRGG
jgi:hypothetical protein